MKQEKIPRQPPRPRFQHAFWTFSSLILASWLGAALSFGEEPSPTSPPPLARWQGGELSRATFRELFDPQGKLLDQGGDRLRNAVCKASFREIYGKLARERGFDRDDTAAEAWASWRESQLATRWLARHRPSFDPQSSPTELQSFYLAHRDTRYLQSAKVDLELLHLRCSATPEERQSCWARAREIDARLQSGVDFSTVVEEEVPRSGNSNGPFRGLVVSQLHTNLQAAAMQLAVGAISAWHELPQGLYRLKILARHAPAPKSFAEVETVVAADWRAAKEAEWLTATRAQLGAAPDERDSQVFARAALAEKLDAEPDFAQAEREFQIWWLADRAFVADRAVFPNEAALVTAWKAVRDQLVQYRLVVAWVRPDAVEPGKAQERLQEVAEKLRAAPQIHEAFRALADVKDLVLEFPPPLTMNELSRTGREVARSLSGGAAGYWRGPMALDRVGTSVSAHWANPPVVAVEPKVVHGFVLIDEVITPTPEEARPELARRLRNRMGASPENFLAVMGPRWGLEILAPAQP